MFVLTLTRVAARGQGFFIRFVIFWDFSPLFLVSV
jgi:hypothetical protein